MQTKATRINPTLVGQAIFSPKLIRHHHQPRSIRSVAIYTKDDPALREVMLAHDVTCHPVDASSHSASETWPILPLLDDYEATIRGTVTRRVTLVRRSPGQPRHIYEALVTEHGEPIAADAPDLAGREATVILTGGMGMSIAGRALLVLDQLRRLGAVDPKVVILTPKADTAMQAALAEFAAVRILSPPFGV